MTRSYGDEELMAFADGQLDEPLFSEIADAVETDPALAERLELLVLGKDLSKAVYGPLADAPVPARLTQAVRGAVVARERATKPERAPLSAAWTGISGWAIAAAIGAVVAGPLGFLLANSSPSSQGIGLQIGAPLSAEVAGYVGAVPSGGEQALADGTLLRPVATFNDASGTLCREFELDGASAIVAVACDQQDQWRVTFALAAPVGQDGYAPAGALEALDAYLASVGATSPMPLEQEAAALQRR
jgi:anti-sigma factor RsiW